MNAPCGSRRWRRPQNKGRIDMDKTPERPKQQPKGDYAVGYARPPVHSRAKKGQVLNPFGRNGKPKDEPDAFDKARNRPSRVTIDGEVLQIPSEEAFYMLQMAKALAGDRHAAKLVAQELAARRRLGPPPLSPAEIAEAMAEAEQKRDLAARLVKHLEDFADAKRDGSAYKGNGIGEAGKIDPPLGGSSGGEP